MKAGDRKSVQKVKDVSIVEEFQEQVQDKKKGGESE